MTDEKVPDPPESGVLVRTDARGDFFSVDHRAGGTFSNALSKPMTVDDVRAAVDAVKERFPSFAPSDPIPVPRAFRLADDDDRFFYGSLHELALLPTHVQIREILMHPLDLERLPKTIAGPSAPISPATIPLRADAILPVGKVAVRYRSTRPAAELVPRPRE